MHSPGFAHELETFVDHPSGVTFQDSFFRGRGREIVPPKVLSYRPSVVLSFLGPWRALFSRARHATALGSQGIACRILGLGGISMAVGYLATFGVIAANTEEAVSSLNAVIAAGLFATEYYYGVSYYGDRAERCAGVFYGGNPAGSFKAAYVSAGTLHRPRRHARRSPRGRDGVRRFGSDRAARARRRASALRLD